MHRTLDRVDDHRKVRCGQRSRERRHAPAKAQGHEATRAPSSLDERRTVPFGDAVDALQRKENQFAPFLNHAPLHGGRAVGRQELDRLTAVEGQGSLRRRQRTGASPRLADDRCVLPAARRDDEIVSLHASHTEKHVGRAVLIYGGQQVEGAPGARTTARSAPPPAHRESTRTTARVASTSRSASPEAMDMAHGSTGTWMTGAASNASPR
jgi:hypothetical protein